MTRQERMRAAKQRVLAMRNPVIPSVSFLPNFFAPQPMLPPAIPSLPHGHRSSLPVGYTIPNRPDFGIASQASVNFFLAFLAFSATLRRNARLEMLRNRTPPPPAGPPALFSCDFESGWCPGWNQSRSDELDMIVHRGPTRTRGTGPSVDHTRFNSHGHYAYLEASGSSFGARAFFRTPYVSMNDEPKYCLRFWYHMFGVGVGTLKVYWSPPKRIGNAPATVFLISAAAGAQSRNETDWKEKAVTIRSPTSFGYRRPVYFEFQAIRGYSYKSDIAVDDISLTVGECGRIRLPTTGTTTQFKYTLTSPTTPGTTTTRSWMETHPDYERCGSQYYNRRSQNCCQSIIKNGGEQSRCCGTNVYNPNSGAICCGDTIIKWHLMQGCCGGNRAYIKNFSGCCNGAVYSRSSSVCRQGNVVPRP